MKIAIVHDELVRKGGAEQVVISFAKAFPNAPIYTLSYNPETTYPDFKGKDIRTTFFGRFFKSEKWIMRLFFPWAMLSMRSLDLSEYDVVLQSTTHCSKYVKVGPNTLVIAYCHTPFRLVWRSDSYLLVQKSGLLKKTLLNMVIGFLKKFDFRASQRIDHFVTNSNEVVPRIIKAYKPEKEVTVINPPVKMDDFYVSKDIGDYYLVVSRFEPYKKVDLVIEAFNEMPGKKLIVVGKGSLEHKLKHMAKGNISFLRDLEKEELAGIMSKCKALIFPQHEDYGITPLEIAASGRPTIAYGAGGVLDTMIPYTYDAMLATAVFFPKQTVASLRKAIMQFEQLTFDPSFIKQHAAKFKEENFIVQIKDFVMDKYHESNGNVNPYKIHLTGDKEGKEEKMVLKAGTK